MSGVSVLLADEQPLFRAGVRAALEQDGFVVCSEADNAAAAIEAARRQQPALCIVDLDLPGGGIGAAASITAAVPATRVVLLTSNGGADRFFDALRAGAWGYLPKRIAAQELHAELRAVLGGEVALPRSLTTRLVEEFRGRDRRRSAIVGDQAVRLTPREWEVLDLLAADRTTAEIATSLHVAPATVRTHVSAILHKLHLSDRRSLRDLSDA